MRIDILQTPPQSIDPLPRQASLVERLHAIGDTEDACGCRDAANGTPEPADAENDLVRRAAGLADARKMRDAIVMVLALLGELDELMPDEPDHSAFHEIADLFDDISGFAASGAKAARQAAGGGNR